MRKLLKIQGEARGKEHPRRCMRKSAETVDCKGVAVATDWVLPSFKLKGKKPISGSQFVKDYIRPRFIQYGLIDAAYKGRAGLHAFRHSLATVLITEEQVDPKTAQGILRHASSDITMDIYTHSQDEAKRKALERYESRWRGENQITGRESQVEIRAET